jgi:hypothetical protein
MYTSFSLAALTGFLLIPSGPTWQSDYHFARKLGEREGKPLAVFIGSGQRGFENISRSGKLSDDVLQLLASKYVCVYVNTNNSSGKQLAANFDLSSGLVISDRTGQLQAFSYGGTLSDADLQRYLTRFSDPDFRVRSTATHTVERISYYPPSPVQTQPYTYPSQFIPAGGFGGGRGC